MVHGRFGFVANLYKILFERANNNLNTLCMTRSASSGYSPFAVSPDSITQSAPSSTAFATSEPKNKPSIIIIRYAFERRPSARVGRGLCVMLSSICVAQMIGFPMRLHFEIIIFCARNTFSDGISMPRSPRATIIPSAASMIESMLQVL